MSKNKKKSIIINEQKMLNSIFIDDSYKERLDVLLNCKIPVLDVGQASYLI